MSPRKAALVAGSVLMFLVSAPGVWSGIRGVGNALTTGQKTTVAGDIIYGAAGIMIVLLLALRRFPPFFVLVAWAVVVTATAAIAPGAWGSARAEAGVLAGTSAAIVAAATVWLTTRGFPARKT
jgi:hypothetical protein